MLYFNFLTPKKKKKRGERASCSTPFLLSFFVLPSLPPYGTYNVAVDVSKMDDPIPSKVIALAKEFQSS